MFLPNIDKYIIEKEIYNKQCMEKYNFNNSNTLCIKGAMGIGKTKQLNDLIYKYDKVVVVSFRRTLDKEYVNNFPCFTLYEDIKGAYDTDIYNKIVVQIDSFYKIIGNIDLLILDEFTYTSMHLIQQVKHKETTFNTLMEYINNQNNKIIVIDALLETNDIKWFYYQKRKIKLIWNTYKKHHKIKIFNYDNKISIFENNIVNSLEKGENIVLATNQKNFLKNIEKIINTKCNRTIKCKFLNAENSDDINLEKWDNYNIVGYTPTIVAGISFEKEHFTKCFGYFTSSSAPAEMCMQQLFRVRNLYSNEMHICVQQNKVNIEYPKNREELEKYIIEKALLNVNEIMGIKLSRIHKTVIKDSYFWLYLDVKFKIYNSKTDFLNNLLKIFKNQGIENIIDVKETNFENDKLSRKHMKECSKEINNKLVEDIINAQEINSDRFDELHKKNYLKYNEKCELKKYNFRKTYNYYDKPIKRDDYVKFSKLTKQYKNCNIYWTFKDNIIKYIQDNLENKENKYNEKMEQIGEIFNNYRLYTANTTLLHKNRLYDKFLIGLEICNKIGLENIFDNKEFNFDNQKIINYLIERKKILELLFNINIDMDKINDIKYAIRILNGRLKYLFNVSIVIANRNKKTYKLKLMENWSDDFNPMKPNEKLMFEYSIMSLLENINM